MIDEGRKLWVAAPTVAEVIRHKGSATPRVRGIAVVAFDDRAAELLGARMPMAKMHEAKTLTGLSLSYLKYDAMIVACAIRIGVPVVVSLDGDHPVLAKDMSLTVRKPSDYYAAQMTLAIGTPLGSASAPIRAPIANDTSSDPKKAGTVEGRNDGDAAMTTKPGIVGTIPPPALAIPDTSRSDA